MKTILTIFFASLVFALLLTPIIAKTAKRFNLVDRPMKRKVHTGPIPRIGGVAIILAFLAPFLGTLFYSNDLIDRIQSEPHLAMICFGAAIIFLLGLADDFFRLHPMVKFGVQTIAALVAYAGGICISQLQLPFAPLWTLGWFSLPVTVFWFLLVTNALNLIDGLDGLAAGVCFFASLTLLILSILGERYLVAAGFAALAGSCLGFLRYNFNPASVFMGDSGSYFLGYMLASLGILGSKSQTTVAILIPIVALGLPLMDTMLSPVRRFIIGEDPFQPDKSHIHHKLIGMGFSQRKAVLLMYGATIILGILALLLVNAQDQKVALTLLLLGICAVLAIRKLGYLEYLAVDKVMGYLHDVTDEIGLKKDRRTFLNHQMAIDGAADTDELWEQVIGAVELLRIDMAQISFNGVSFSVPEDGQCRWCSREIDEVPVGRSDSVMSLDLPLLDDQRNYGMLSLKKDILSDPMDRYTLGRIEHLRRSIVRKLKAFEKEAKLKQ